MHPLLQEIVRCKFPKELGQHRRLWHYKDILHVLKNNSVSELVKTIRQTNNTAKAYLRSIHQLEVLRWPKKFNLGHCEFVRDLKAPSKQD